MTKVAPTCQSRVTTFTLSRVLADNMRGAKRTLLLLIVVTQACQGIKILGGSQQRDGPGPSGPPGPETDSDGCINQVVLVEEESEVRGAI